MSTAIEALERIRSSLVPLIETAAAEVEAEQRAAAEAIEAAMCPPSSTDAYRQGRQDERQRCVALLDLHAGQLRQAGVPSFSLASLRRALLEEAS